MALPIFEKFLYPFLVAVDAQSLEAKEIRAEVAKALNLTDADMSVMTKGGRKLQYIDRIDWSRQYLRRAGLIESDGSKWKSTSAGHDYLKNHNDLTRDDLLKFPDFAEFVNGTSDTTNQDPVVNTIVTPTAQFKAAFQEINKALAKDLLDTVKKMDPKAFEQLVVDLMKKMGYGEGNPTQYVKDGGIDGIMYKDKLGLDQIFIQAKRWSDTTVSSPEVQKFIGAMAGRGATKGVFFTTSKFSEDAYKCIGHGLQKVILIDGDNLADLMIEHNLGVHGKPEEVYIIKTIDTDYFEELSNSI